MQEIYTLSSDNLKGHHKWVCTLTNVIWESPSNSNTLQPFSLNDFASYYWSLILMLHDITSMIKISNFILYAEGQD